MPKPLVGASGRHYVLLEGTDPERTTMHDDWPNPEDEWNEGRPSEDGDAAEAWSDDLWSDEPWSEEDGPADDAPAPVPEILRSEYSGEAFESCLVCGTDLAGAEMHIVEKMIRGGEAVMEMALCGTCAEAMARDCSEESLETIRATQESWAEAAEDDPTTCAGCGKAHGIRDAFVIAGYFLAGYELMRSLTVCESCHESVQQKLSRATRERFGEFIRDHFPGVPENIDSPVGFESN
jgi:hypothetical protein